MFLSYFSLRPIFVLWLLLLLSSTFHGKLVLLPFLMVKSPPFTSIFFFLFLSWSNNLSTTSTNLHHKNKNPLAPQESKPTSTDSVDPQAPISAARTDMSLCWFVCVGVFVYLCVDLSVCLCVSEEKDHEERSQFVLHKEGREKKKKRKT